MKWYNTIQKSRLNPPSWVFRTVWPILYAIMSVSLYLVWNNKKCYPYCKPLNFFFIQLFFNLIWTTVFFKWKMPKLALVITILIIFFTIITYREFLIINKTASYLLIPYLLWLVFALYLNSVIIYLN